MDISTILNELQKGAAEIIGLEKIQELIKNYYEKGEHFLACIGW